MPKKKKKSRPKLPSLSVFARRQNPFDEPDLLLRRLRLETSESRHLEWKIMAPFGPAVTRKIKCRMLKALISFANTEGGFLVFGVDPQGHWIGLTPTEMKDTDAAMIAEMVNECVSPDLVGLNYGLLKRDGKLFPVLHVPPSPSMPHVTTKEMVEKLPDGRTVVYLKKYAVYCRFAAKSDLATASQYSRIIAQRTDMLRREMLRVVRKVDLPSNIIFGESPAEKKPIIRIARMSSDPSAPAVRITRNPAEASGIVVQEELSQGIFSEINNVLDANRLLAVDELTFVLGDSVYYRIYAERDHVDAKEGRFEMLARTALLKLYAPSFSWLLRLPVATVAKIIKDVTEDSHSTHMHLVCRIALLMGPEAVEWLTILLDNKWKGHAQPPGHYFSFKKMKSVVAGGEDPRVGALQQSASSKIRFSISPNERFVKDLMADTASASSLLSKTCMAVFGGNTSDRSACRELDILAYGAQLPRICKDVLTELSKLDNATKT